MSITTDHLAELLAEVRACVRRDLPGVLGEPVHEILDDIDEAVCDLTAEWGELVRKNELLAARCESFDESFWKED